MTSPKAKYPEKKERELTEDEKMEIRAKVQSGDGNIYSLAQRFHCSSSQVAGVKAAMSR